MTRYGLLSGARRTATASEEARAAGAAYSSGRLQPVVESRTPIAARHADPRLPMLLSPPSPAMEPLRSAGPLIGCVVGRCSPRQPLPERFRFPRQAPLLEDRLGHGPHATVPLSGGPALLQQPRFEIVRLRVGGDRQLQELPLEGEPDGVGCGIALAPLAASFRRVERRQELATDVAGPAEGGFAGHGSAARPSPPDDRLHQPPVRARLRTSGQ